MKLIMENWNKFLKENETPAGPWLENLKQVAMDYLIANPGVEIADVPIKDIFAHAGRDPDMDVDFQESNLDPEQKSWWLFGAKGINDIHLGAQEGAEEAEHVATDMPGGAPGNAPDKGPILREDADDDNDADEREATGDGEADGASGSKRGGPGGHFQKYYDEAYNRAAKKSK